MNISFPQKLFSSPSKDNVFYGKNIAKKSKILFCGIARNVEKTLKDNVRRLDYLGQYFNGHDIFVYENDSVDATVDILKECGINHVSETRKDADYKSIINSGKDSNHYNRCKVLANCRNRYLDYCRNSGANFDYICVLDWDIHGWSYAGFFDSIYRLHNDIKLASVSAYGLLSDYANAKNIEDNIDNLLMYDSFAFRPQGCYKPITPQIQSSFNFYKTDKPALVRSNFGGMTIYKPVILNFNYSAKTTNDYVDCDHVCINDEISKLGFKHLLNNYFIVSYSKHRYIK